MWKKKQKETFLQPAESRLEINPDDRVYFKKKQAAIVLV